MSAAARSALVKRLPGAMLRTLAERKLWATASAAVSSPTFRGHRLE